MFIESIMSIESRVRNRWSFKVITIKLSCLKNGFRVTLRFTTPYWWGVYKYISVYSPIWLPLNCNGLPALNNTALCKLEMVIALIKMILSAWTLVHIYKQHCVKIDHQCEEKNLTKIWRKDSWRHTRVRTDCMVISWCFFQTAIELKVIQIVCLDVQ